MRANPTPGLRALYVRKTVSLRRFFCGKYIKVVKKPTEGACLKVCPSGTSLMGVGSRSFKIRKATAMWAQIYFYLQDSICCRTVLFMSHNDCSESAAWLRKATPSKHYGRLNIVVLLTFTWGTLMQRVGFVDQAYECNKA